MDLMQSLRLAGSVKKFIEDDFGEFLTNIEIEAAADAWRRAQLAIDIHEVSYGLL
jgi:hypothetical protein